MSYENAKANLKELGKELNLQGLEFDENKTCILGIDNTFSVHVTYEERTDAIFIYSPIADELPKNPTIRLNLFEAFLVGSMLGGQMAGGGIGIALKEELVLMHCILPMGIGVDPMALRRFAGPYVETVEKWRRIAKDIMAGNKPQDTIVGLNAPVPTVPMGGPGASGQPAIGPSAASPQTGPSAKPGQPFIKI